MLLATRRGGVVGAVLLALAGLGVLIGITIALTTGGLDAMYGGGMMNGGSTMYGGSMYGGSYMYGGMMYGGMMSGGMMSGS